MAVWMEMSGAPADADQAGLAAHALTARIGDVDGQPGVVLDDGDGELPLSEVFGRRADIIRGYRHAAGVMLARAATLEALGPDRNRGET